MKKATSDYLSLQRAKLTGDRMWWAHFVLGVDQQAAVARQVAVQRLIEDIRLFGETAKECFCLTSVGTAIAVEDFRRAWVASTRYLVDPKEKT